VVAGLYYASSLPLGVVSQIPDHHDKIELTSDPYARGVTMKTIYGVLIVFCYFLVNSSFCIAKVESAGFVKSVSGEVFITTSSQMTVVAVANMKIVPGDSIRTGAKSSVGLIFEDDTVVSLGPQSEIMIQEFLFNPADKELAFFVRMIRGTFSFISGQIAKLDSQKVKLETPDATLGVRGTKILLKID